MTIYRIHTWWRGKNDKIILKSKRIQIKHCEMKQSLAMSLELLRLSFILETDTYSSPILKFQFALAVKDFPAHCSRHTVTRHDDLK